MKKGGHDPLTFVFYLAGFIVSIIVELLLFK